MNIWNFQQDLARRLLIWSALSVFSGLVLQLLRNPFGRGLGRQFTGWGLADGIIAVFGFRSVSKQLSRLQNSVNDLALAEKSQRDQTTLQRLLEINTGLDILYVAGGLNTARTKGNKDAYWRGTSLGVVLQGGFLFFFDLIHAVRLRRKFNR